LKNNIPPKKERRNEGGEREERERARERRKEGRKERKYLGWEWDDDLPNKRKEVLILKNLSVSRERHKNDRSLRVWKLVQFNLIRIGE
jgi:hypothetical protein